MHADAVKLKLHRFDLYFEFVVTYSLFYSTLYHHKSTTYWTNGVWALEWRAVVRIKLKFHGSSFLVASCARMSATSRACSWTLRTTRHTSHGQTGSTTPRADQTGKRMASWTGEVARYSRKDAAVVEFRASRVVGYGAPYILGCCAAPDPVWKNFQTRNRPTVVGMHRLCIPTTVGLGWVGTLLCDLLQSYYRSGGTVRSENPVFTLFDWFFFGNF